MRLGAMEDNHDEIVKAIEELKSTLQGQLKHQEKQMNAIILSNFQGQRGKFYQMEFQKLHLIMMVAWEWQGNYLSKLFMSSKLWHIMCKTILLVSFLN